MDDITVWALGAGVDLHVDIDAAGDSPTKEEGPAGRIVEVGYAYPGRPLYKFIPTSEPESTVSDKLQGATK